MKRKKGRMKGKIDSKKKKKIPDSPIMLQETTSIEESQPEQLQLELPEQIMEA